MPPLAEPSPRATDAICGAAAAALVLLQTTLVWSIPYPVGTDLPGHVAILSILSRYEALGFDAFFTVAWTPTPYMVANGLILFFARFVGEMAALKIVLTLYFALLPVCAAAWASSGGAPRGRAAAAALFGAAFAFNNPFFGGSLNHLWGLLTALALLAFWFEKPVKNAARRRILLALGLVALYFCHFTPFVFTALVLLAAAAAGGDRRRQLPEVFAGLAAPLALFLWFARDAGLAAGIPPFGGTPFNNFARALYHRLTFPFGAFDFWGDLLTQAPTLAAYAVLVWRGWRHRPPDRSRALAVVIGTALALLLPHTHLLTHPIACRIWHLTLFLGLAFLAPPGRRTLPLLVLGAVSWNVYAVVRLAHLQEPVGAYMRILDRIPPRQAVFPLFEGTTKGPESRVFSPYEYLVGYYHAEKGGVSPNLPDRLRSPWAAYIFYRDARYKADSVLRADFDPQRYAPFYPYVVYKGSPRGAAALAGRYRVTARERDIFLLVRTD